MTTPRNLPYACLLTLALLAATSVAGQSTTDGMMDDDMGDGMMHEDEDSPGVGLAALVVVLGGLAAVAVRRRLG